MPFDWRSGHPEQGRGVTQAGMILGTAAYMSPEQAKGKPVDKRTDIWAFGCVLCEMLTGTRAFAAADVTDCIIAVMTKEPDWTRLPAATPPRIVEIVDQGQRGRQRRSHQEPEPQRLASHQGALSMM